jgi:hypothetical protein
MTDPSDADSGRPLAGESPHLDLQPGEPEGSQAIDNADDLAHPDSKSAGNAPPRGRRFSSLFTRKKKPGKAPKEQGDLVERSGDWGLRDDYPTAPN